MDNETYFNIRSKECISISNNCDLVVSLPYEIELNADEWCKVQIISAEIPLSFYNVSSDLENNILKYSLDASSTIINLTLINGNYTVDTILSTINASQSHFTLSYNDIYNKFFITCISPITAVKFIYNNSDYAQQLYGIIQNLTITGSGYISGVCNLSSVHSLMIRSSLCSSNSCSTSQTSNDIIGKVALDVNQNGIAIFNQNSFIRTNYIKGGTIKNFTLKITEQNNKIINLNSCNYELTLLFTIVKHNLHNITEEQMMKRRSYTIQENAVEAPRIEQPPIRIEQPPIRIEQPIEPPPEVITLKNDTSNNEKNTYDKLQDLLLEII
jgi:hypothetical protein